jgi:phosphoglycerate dehydrogenase-like enzyme
MSGADLGLIGFGRIGRAVIQKLSGFKMNVRVYDPYVDAAVIEGGGGAKVTLEELLKAAQFVLVACPLNDETRGLVGEKELRMMRPDAVLVNSARGGIVDEKALVRALREHWILAAALDVVANPPLDPSDELLSLENLNITPHVGGYPYNYPDGLFYSSVDVIIEMSRMHLPRWIANKGVVPKWKMTIQTGQGVQP